MTLDKGAEFGYSNSMSVWSDLASRTSILFREPVTRQEARILEIDGRFEVIRPLGLPVRVKRGNLYQKRFHSREQAEIVKSRWEQDNKSKIWTEVEDGFYSEEAGLAESKPVRKS
jgi:hypothetical protein